MEIFSRHRCYFGEQLAKQGWLHSEAALEGATHADGASEPRLRCNFLQTESVRQESAGLIESQVLDEMGVVRDRNRLSGGGVTAGIDFGLTLAAELAGEETARLVQLSLEYAPEPPFDCGTPERAGAERVALFRARIQPLYEQRAEAVKAAVGA